MVIMILFFSIRICFYKFPYWKFLFFTTFELLYLPTPRVSLHFEYIPLYDFNNTDLDSCECNAQTHIPFFGFCLLFLHMYVYAHPKYRHVLLCFFSYPPHYLYHGNQCWRPNSSTQVCLCSDDLFITSRYTHVLRDTHTFILLNIRLFCLTARPFSSPH